MRKGGGEQSIEEGREAEGDGTRELGRERGWGRGRPDP